MSEFWKRKMRTYFHSFDQNKAGVIPKADWVGKATTFANFEKADKQKEEHVKTQLQNIFEQFMKVADPADKNLLTAEVLTDAVGKLRYDPELMKHYRGLVEGLFEMMDLNNDGYLDEYEYQRYLEQCGIQSESFAKEALRTMDVNHNGKLSLDEFLNAFWDFFFSDDERSPNAFFFGPLVD